jgi:flavin reductase (DIM6/NTAB) family NADH-FMN oxidoreductase RutF
MARRPYPLSKVYGLLEPGPVVLLITAHQGKANVMPMSWHTMLKFEPPLVSCVVSGRDFSFAALKATRHCVLNIPTAECCANLECKVVDTRLVNRCNFLVLEVLKSWIDTARKDPRSLHHWGHGVFRVAGESIKLPSKMK